MFKLKESSAVRYYTVDVLRGVASFVVVVWHYQHFYYSSEFNITDQPFYDLFSWFYMYGKSAVQLFWVISGFVFAATYMRSQTTSVKAFFMNRFARLYPLHFLTLVVVAALQIVSSLTMHHFQIYEHNDLYHFVLNLAFVSNWGFEVGDSFNGPIWSVSVEIFIYIVFYVCLSLLKRNPIVTTGLAFFTFYLIERLNLPLSQFALCGLYFFLGISVYILVNLLNRNFKYLLIILSLVGIGLAFVVVAVKSNYVNSLYQHIFLFPSLVLLCGSIDCLGLGKQIGRFRMMGDLSFGIYLWHVPLQIAIILVVENGGLARELYSGSLFFITFILGVITLAYFSHRYYELPLRNYFRKNYSREDEVKIETLPTFM